jgi:DNA polymerase-3 subunit alpha
LDPSILKSVGFVHLHVHSAFSLREGALGIEALAKLAKADQMPALAITDTNNLFGGLEFSEKLAKSGIQPIVGAQIAVDFADGAGAAGRLERRAARESIVLLTQSEAGYRNLMRIVSSIWLDCPNGEEPHIRFDALGEIDGLIALTGGPDGPIDRALAAQMEDVAAARLARLAERFDCSGTASNRSGRSSRRCSIWLTPAVCRWSRPTSLISPRRPTTRRRTRCCASPMAR